MKRSQEQEVGKYLWQQEQESISEILILNHVNRAERFLRGTGEHEEETVCLYSTFCCSLEKLKISEKSAYKIWTWFQ